MLVRLPTDHGAIAVREGLVKTINALPEYLRKSLTWDQGTELAQHRQITVATRMDIYFCEPHSPWQRGTNESTNGLLNCSPKVGLTNSFPYFQGAIHRLRPLQHDRLPFLDSSMLSRRSVLPGLLPVMHLAEDAGGTRWLMNDCPHLRTREQPPSCRSPP